MNLSVAPAYGKNLVLHYYGAREALPNGTVSLKSDLTSAALAVCLTESCQDTDPADLLGTADGDAAGWLELDASRRIASLCVALAARKPADHASLKTVDVFLDQVGTTFQAVGP